MDNSKDTNTDLFSKVKEAFNQLDLDQKAIFIVTQSVNTVVEALTTVADRVTEEFTQFVSSEESNAQKPDEDSSEDQAP